MHIITVSDIHISHNNSEAIGFWENFVVNDLVLKSEKIILMGDIFDLMIGGKRQYLTEYKFFFDSLLKLIKKGKSIVYIEGNHDFHLESVFEKFKKINNLCESDLFYSKDEYKLKLGNKSILFCHGDIVDNTNESFKKWKSIYRSEVFKFFVNYIIPFFVIKKLGEKASKDSKKRNSKSFDYEESKKLYREGSIYVYNQERVDYIIAGHTHIIDHYKTEDFEYLNNGFPARDNCFISLSESEIKLVNLKDS